MLNMKKFLSELNNKELLIISLVSIVMALIFTIPLKSLCKICNFPFWSFLGLSGIISYINTKVFQYLKGNSIDPNALEFFYVFSFSLCSIFFTTIIGYPIVGYIISCNGLLITSLKLDLYNLLKDFFTNPMYMTIGNEVSDEISDKPLKRKSNLSKPLLVNNTESLDSNNNNTNNNNDSNDSNNNNANNNSDSNDNNKNNTNDGFVSSGLLNRYPKDPAQRSMWTYEVGVFSLEKITQIFLRDEWNMARKGGLPLKSELFDTTTPKELNPGEQWSDWYISALLKRQLSAGQLAFYNEQKAQIEYSLINKYNVEPHKAKMAAQRLASYNLMRETELSK